MKKITLSLLVIFLIYPLSDAHARLLVAVTVPAQAWLVKQIAGDHVDLLIMVPPGHVPESAQPGPRNMARFQQADVHLTVGHPGFFFETRYITPYQEKYAADSWISMYDLAARLIPTHTLENSDPHLWTSPEIMMVTADVIEQTLSRLDPENTDIFRTGLQRLNKKISSFNDQLRAQLEGRVSDKLLVFHPAWGHFCQDFGLQQLAIEEDAKAPGAGSLSRLFTQLEKNDMTNIISSPGADQRISSMIADQFKLDLILVNPMDFDWYQMMLKMKSALESNNHDR